MATMTVYITDTVITGASLSRKKLMGDAVVRLCVSADMRGKVEVRCSTGTAVVHRPRRAAPCPFHQHLHEELLGPPILGDRHRSARHRAVGVSTTLDTAKQAGSGSATKICFTRCLRSQQHNRSTARAPPNSGRSCKRLRKKKTRTSFAPFFAPFQAPTTPPTIPPSFATPNAAAPICNEQRLQLETTKLAQCHIRRVARQSGPTHR
jgi:hypothetical protein